MAQSLEFARRFQCFQHEQSQSSADQACLPALAGEHVFITVDTLNVHVHFRADDDPAAIGHKALAVNLSDLAAMGARARWVSLVMRAPDVLPAAWYQGFCAGFDGLACRHDVALRAALLSPGPLSVTVEALGTAPAGVCLRRDGARAGDRILVSGTVGDAAAALQLRMAGKTAAASLQRRLDRPEPRLALGAGLRGIATSAIDISDGLLADLQHILEASTVGARIEIDRLPLSADLCATLQPSAAVETALTGGDDYELCCTVPPGRCAAAFEAAQQCGVPLTDIGVIEPEPGVRVLDQRGQPIYVLRSGFDHFAS